ncbi:MAG TPA: YceI family protein [Hanamia sp.]|jgi:polyisoprenoid-binding protein YceI|nr:YceI family protein [Hanamia sp.]
MSLTKWSLDPTHSEVSFKVKHLMISTVTGQFKKFSLEGETETDDFNTSKKIQFSADIDSIDTNNEQRDAHLKSADFFNAPQHPKIVFSGIKYEGAEDGKLYGDLTIAGITRPVTLNVEFGGIVVDPYGQTKAGFTVTGKISRKEFGITYGAVTETGGVLLGDEIKVNAEIQLVKQAAAQEEMAA